MSQKFKSEIELQSLNNATTDTDRFLVSDSGIVKYRTGAEVLSDLGITLNTASVLKHQVKAGVAINKGQAVYVTSADGTNMIVGLASNASEVTSSKTMGLLDATVAINGFANVITEGLLAGLNTVGANAGDPVWLGTGGNLIYGLTNKPYAPAHMVFIGIVTRVNANNGEIFVKVQNGFELDELHNVDINTTTPINGHLLGFNGTLWVNKTIAQWLGYTPANANGTTNYVSKFTGSTTLGDSQIFDDGFNVGIGTNTPSDLLTVAGNIRSSYFVASMSYGEFFAGGGGSIAGYGESAFGYGEMWFNTNGSERVRIDSSGNVGIGTSVPYSKLDVRDYTSFLSLSSSINSEATTDNLQIGGIDFRKHYSLAIGASIKQLQAGGTNNYSNAHLAFYTNNGSVAFGSVPPERMRITDRGDIGIGTTNPNFASSGRTVLSLNGSTNSLMEFKAGDAFRSYFHQNGSYFEIYETSTLRLSVNGNERMRITSDGNVGIGTTSPASGNKLEVNGKIFSDQLQYTRAIDITGADLNDYATAGFYNGSSMTNAPNSGWFWISVERYTADTGWVHQTATSFGSGNTQNLVYTRTKTGGNWSPWREMYHTGNLLNPTTGTGTTNYVPKFTSATTLGNSQIFDNGTNIGIGTTTPGAKLEVAGASRFTGAGGRSVVIEGNGAGRIDINGDGSTYATGILFNSQLGGTALSGIWNYGSGTSQQWLALGGTAYNNSSMYILPSGNIGIGTTSPNYRTQIETIGADVFLTKNTSSTSFNRSYFYNNNNVGIQFLNFGSAYGFGTEFSVGQNGSVIQSNTTSAFAIGTSGAYPLFFGTSGTERMRINSIGNVGIGTTSPAAGHKLEVAGRIASVNSFGDFTALQSAGGTGFRWTLSNNDTFSLQKTANGFSTLSATPIMVDSSNNIGINTTAPQRRLDIVGNHTTSTFRVYYPALDVAGQDASVDIWASEPGVTYNGSGIGSNVNGHPYYGRTNTALGQAFVRFINGNMIFHTSTGDALNAERMRISPNGNVGIGNTSQSAKLHVTINDNAYGSAMLVENNNSGAQAIAGYNMWCNNKIASINTFSDGAVDVLAQHSHIRFRSKGYYSFWINYDTGTSTPRLSIGTSETATHPLRVSSQVSNVSIYADYDIVAYSDESVKENIRPIKNALKRVINSRGVLYDRTDSGEKNNIGFIAQELEVAFPELVVTNEDGTKAVKYQNAVAVLFEAIKEQQKQIDEIKNILNGNT